MFISNGSDEIIKRLSELLIIGRLLYLLEYLFVLAIFLMAEMKVLTMINQNSDQRCAS